MALNIPFRNAYYRFASSYSFLFFISWSLWWSLYAIWLKGHLGLTGTELGTLYSVNQFTSILFMMFYGIVQDQFADFQDIVVILRPVPCITGLRIHQGMHCGVKYRVTPYFAIRILCDGYIARPWAV